MKKTVSFTLRMPEDLHAALEQASKVCRHSMNMLAVDAIERSLQPPKKSTVSDEIRAVWEADFTKLEERVLAHLQRGWEACQPKTLITEMTINPPVVTGGIPEIDPQEINDAINTAIRLRGGVMDFTRGDYTGGSLHHGTGGHLAAPDAEFLTKGEAVMEHTKRLPLKGQVWVITGSLETMTRDRAREILMELGATVAGMVTPNTDGLIWGPGAGSKMQAAEKYGVQRWNERQFIHMIQGLGVDMPLPKAAAEQHRVTPGDLEWDAPVAVVTGLVWTENRGCRPETLKQDQHIDFVTRNGTAFNNKPVGAVPNSWWTKSPSEPRPLIAQWRLSSIELQPKVEPRATK